MLRHTDLVESALKMRRRCKKKYRQTGEEYVATSEKSA